MDVYKIKGGKRLSGTIKVNGAKKQCGGIDSRINLGELAGADRRLA
jgi:hypothetical protein